MTTKVNSSEPAKRHAGGKQLRRSSWRLIAVAGLTFCAQFSEGEFLAVADQELDYARPNHVLY